MRARPSLLLLGVALAAPRSAHAQLARRTQDPAALPSTLPPPDGPEPRTLAPEGPPPRFYWRPPSAQQRFGLRFDFGGGVRLGHSPEPAFVLAIVVPLRVGFGRGQHTPALWTELGCLLSTTGTPVHAFVVGAGPGAQSRGVSFGYVPRLVLGSSLGSFVVGLRHSLHVEFAGPIFAVLLAHQLIVTPNGLTHEIQLTVGIDVLGVLVRLTGLDRG